MQSVTQMLRAIVLGSACLAAPVAASTGALAAEPDVIFKKSTVWKFMTPDDKLVVSGIDDPLVDGVACHFTLPEKGGVSGMFGVAEEVSDVSLACRQVGPVSFRQSSRRAMWCFARAAR